MNQVNFFIGSRYPVNRRSIRATVERVLAEHRIDQAVVDVSVVGARKIATLNEQHLQHHGPTDVLSFPQYEPAELAELCKQTERPPLHLGDIVVSFPKAVQMARRFGKLVDAQIDFYVEHALLHLLGFHHDDH